MAKATYYFSHDCHARDDRKLKKVRVEIGLAGIGAYWCLVEMLYEEKGYLPVSDIPSIAKDLKIQVRTLEKLINSYELFETSDGVFTSLSVLSRLSLRLSKSEAARNSALVRWNNGANAMRTQCERNANKVKNNKVKNNIVKEIKKKYGEYKNVLLSDEEYGKLVTKFGDDGTKKWIAELSTGIELKGYKYKSHYLAILKWKENEKSRGNGNGTNRQSAREVPTTYTRPEDL